MFFDDDENELMNMKEKKILVMNLQRKIYTSQRPMHGNV